MKTCIHYCLITTLAITQSTLYTAEKSTKLAHYEQKQFAYLGSQTFQKRHQLAAEWTKDCSLIIEIGGGRNNMIPHCTKEQKIIVIDPSLKNRDEDNTSQIGKNFESWNIPKTIYDQNYAVIILGLDLSTMQQHGWSKLYDLIDKSKTTVIEHSATFKPAKKQFKTLIKNIVKTKIAIKEFNFSQSEELKGEKYKNNINPYARIMYLLE